MHQLRKEKLLFYVVFLFTLGCDDMGFESEEDNKNQENETSTYSMPSIILGSNVSISIYNNLSFDDIISIPDDLEWSSDTSITSYEKEYEVLHYNMNIHKISVSTNNHLLRENITHKIFKLHFEEYHSGVVLFSYAELDGENQNSIAVVTSNFYQEPFYFNFITSTEDTTDWHISLQKISVEY